MTHKFNPGFDDWAYFDCEDGPGTSPTSVGGWPEREYRDPLLDMANRVAGLPERVAGASVYERFFLKGDLRAPLRLAIHKALLADLPVMAQDRFDALVERVVAAVEALGEPEDERARRLAR